MARRRWPMMVGGLLAAGAAVGAAGALISRRRSRNRWTEFNTGRTSTTISDDARSMLDSAKSALDNAVDNASDKLSNVKGETAGQGPRPTDKTNTLGQYSGQTAGASSKNSRP